MTFLNEMAKYKDFDDRKVMFESILVFSSTTLLNISVFALKNQPSTIDKVLSFIISIFLSFIIGSLFSLFIWHIIKTVASYVDKALEKNSINIMMIPIAFILYSIAYSIVQISKITKQIPSMFSIKINRNESKSID